MLSLSFIFRFLDFFLGVNVKWVFENILDNEQSGHCEYKV